MFSDEGISSRHNSPIATMYKSIRKSCKGLSETPLHFIFRYEGDSAGRYRRYPLLANVSRGEPIRVNMDEQNTLDLYKEYIQAFESKDYQVIADVLCRTPFFSSPSGTTIFGN